MTLATHYDIAYFGRTLGADEGESGGSILRHRLSLRGGFETRQGTRLAAVVPFGAVTLRSDREAGRSSFGPGDVALSVGQELLPWLVRPPPLPMSLVARIGAVAPTGSYQPGMALSLGAADPVASPLSGLAVTYDSQASLGGGVWALTSELDAQARVAGAVDLAVSVAWQSPLGRTEDGMHWGDDVWLRALSRVEPWGGAPVALLGGLERQFHGRDEVPDPDPDALEPHRRRIGGRRALSAVVGVQVVAGDETTCFVHSRLPLLRSVGGTQLVESASASIGCALRLEL